MPSFEKIDKKKEKKEKKKGSKIIKNDDGLKLNPNQRWAIQNCYTTILENEIKFLVH